LKIDASACKIIRYRMAHLIWFALSNAAFVGVGVSALESRGIISTITECLNICSPFQIPAKLYLVWKLHLQI